MKLADSRMVLDLFSGCLRISRIFNMIIKEDNQQTNATP